MNIVAIMQARMGSTRLPGKVLLDIAGETMLARAVKRLQKAKTLSKIVVATTTETVDDQLVAYCAQMQWACTRGSETDVLDRYYKAATQYQADMVVRITSDCPLIEPEIVDQVVAHFLAANPAYDYVSNVFQFRTFPRGLDTEVFTMEALKRAWQEDQNASTREHVTPYLYQQPELFSVGGFSNPVDYSHHRWTVDTPEDLELIRRIYDHFRHDKFNWHDVLALLKENPDWLLINQHIEQKKIGA